MVNISMQGSTTDSTEDLFQAGSVANTPDILQYTFGYLASSVKPIPVINK